MKQKTNENIPLRVLYLEDLPQDIEIIQKLLIEAGYDLILDCAEKKNEFTTLIRSNKYDIILSDFKLQGFDAFGALELCMVICPDVPFICVSGSIGEETAIELIKKGAADYVLKDHMVRLPLAIRHALEETNENKFLQSVEEEQQKSERRFQVLTENSPVGMFQTDAEGSIIYGNPRYCQLSGLSKEEVLGNGWLSTVHSDDRIKLKKGWLKAPWVSDSFITEYRIVRKDGTIVWVICQAVPERNSNNKIIGYIGTITDITKRKRAEEALQESETRYRSVLQSATDAIVTVDGSGIIIGWNSGAERIFGYGYTEVVGQSLASIISLNHYDEHANGMKGLQSEKGQSVLGKIVEFKGIRRDKSVFPVEFSLSTWETESEQFFTGIIRDITERKRAEEKIVEQARMIEVAIDAIIVCDIDDRLLFWNIAAKKLYGWTFEEACSLDISSIVVDEEKEKYEKSMQEFLQKGEWEGEFHQKTKDGRVILIHTRWTLVKDKDGKPTSRLIITRDVTEQRALESQFRRAQRLENLGTLAGGIAHDLNNVLAPILMATQVIEKRTTDPQIKKIVGSMEKSVKRGRDIIKQVLLFARGGEEGFAPQQLKYVINEMRSIVRETFPQNIEISINVTEDLKIIQGDATQLHQVLMNLCINARDAMPKGGKISINAFNISVEAMNLNMYDGIKPGNYILLKVADTGIGIPKEIQDKVFDPFFTTKEVGKGTGLGLSTVFSIVKDHKGFIKLSSEVGKGTEVKIFLPAVIGDKQVPAVEEVIDIQSANGETILIVDDESAILQISREALESFGYKVITATNGSDALLKFMHAEKGMIRLVIIDSHMPVMDGATTIGLIRQVDPNIKIILSSGTVDIDTLDLSQMNVHRTLVKPYTAKKMLETVWSVLHN